MLGSIFHNKKFRSFPRDLPIRGRPCKSGNNSTELAKIAHGRAATVGLTCEPVGIEGGAPREFIMLPECYPVCPVERGLLLGQEGIPRT